MATREIGPYGRIIREDDDTSLMEGVRDGCRESLGVLLARYWDPLTSYAAGIVGSQDDADDVVQNTFVRVWRHRDSWHPSGKVSVYLYRITRNLALNALRDHRARQKRDSTTAQSLEESPRTQTPERDLESARLRAEVEAAIQALPERRREVFVLSRFHGLTHGEIAEAMGISSQTVANQMTAALSDLRRVLQGQLAQL